MNCTVEISFAVMILLWSLAVLVGMGYAAMQVYEFKQKGTPAYYGLWVFCTTVAFWLTLLSINQLNTLTTVFCP